MKQSLILCAALVMLAGAWAAPVLAQELTGPAPGDRDAASTPAASAAQEVPQEEAAERSGVRFDSAADNVDAAVDALVADMSLAEKIGQLCQVVPEAKTLTPELRAAIRKGQTGSIINAPDKAFIDEVQRIAREESPHGIPLLIGRDVVHGFRTVFPIPLGQAASWNPELVERAAEVAARESQSEGINWTFAPMVDVCRDPRWGRIAESLGEDPVLAGALAAAMVRGLQQEREEKIHGILACVKHFAAYGLSEGGRDYNRASASKADLHNIYLPPFREAIEAGCRTLMTTFSEVNGVPGTANAYLLTDVLRGDWGFDGFVVSDWNSVIEMVEHGFSADASEAARQALSAGVDMEMVSPTYHQHLASLIERGAVSEQQVNQAVRRILHVKFQLAAAAPSDKPLRRGIRPNSLEAARKLARESIVLLKNADGALPLAVSDMTRVAVIGPMAEAPQSQLGCWALDGDPADVITPLAALRDAIGESVEVTYAAGATADFSEDSSGIEEAAALAAGADVALVFVGEDALLSGEARSRADLGLPGAQSELVRAVAATGTPTVLVVLAGRPLTIGKECELADAVLYAWHPGAMGGPAITDLLLGIYSPSGKLPVTFPKAVGQIPLYYSHTNTGRPSPHTLRPLAGSGAKDLPVEFQYRSHYLDSDPFPLFPFGYGLSYSKFAYSDVQTSAAKISPGQVLGVTARVTNTGPRAGVETVQLYVRDLVASMVRPVKELKAFRRIHLRPGETKTVEFALTTDQLAFYDNDGRLTLEPGRFLVGVGGDSSVELGAAFEVTSGETSTEKSPAPVVRDGQASPAEARNQRGSNARPKAGS